MSRPKPWAPVAYVAAIVAANILTERFGLVPVGFGLVATAGTYAAAFALVSRNITQDQIGRVRTLALMSLGVALSWRLASPALALASATAFALSETADMCVYTPLRKRGRGRAVAVASTTGALIDTVAFLLIAGFPVLPSLPGQLLVKVGMALVAALILRGRRAVHGESVDTAGA